MIDDVVLLSGVRTAIGSFGGALEDMVPAEPGCVCAVEAIKQEGIASDDIGHVMFGQVVSTRPSDAYLACGIAVNAEIPLETPAMTVNRLCGSGVERRFHSQIVPIAVKTRKGIQQFDVAEANEACASQACAVLQELRLDPAKTNVNGSGISLGHPVGATGAIILVKLLYELERSGGRHGLATMCIGGGQGIALIIVCL